jgi:hypothetical protein
MRWTTRNKLAAATTAVCGYLLVACWLQISYVADPIFTFGPDVPGEKKRLLPPFKLMDGPNLAVVKERGSLFDDLADSDDDSERSRIELYENSTRLGPPHSTHLDIVNLGHGRFSHWRARSSAMYWSSSDNTDPNTNGRAYWIVRPPPN